MPWVWVFTPEQQERGVHAVIADTPRIPLESVDPTAKNFHWGDLTRASFEAHDQGAETAILLDFAGNVTEGPGFNVFAVVDGTVLSPPRGALEGITRLTVFELCESLGVPHEIRTISRAEIEGADEIFLSTTAGGVMPVSRLGARILGNDRPGPIASSLRKAFLGPATRRLACDANRLFVISGGRTRGRRPSDALIEVALERSQIGATKIARGRGVA
jgi:branched-chain amino acid aminotransferase